MKGTERFGHGLLDALAGKKPVPELELELVANRLAIAQRTQTILKAEVDALDTSIADCAAAIERLKKDLGK